MALEGFYNSASQLCFTLLGFWWAVVQFRHGEWMKDPSRRRMAYAVSLHFLLPGVMSLLSLVSQAPFMWRATFGIAGLTGVVATLLIVASMRSEGSRAGLARAGHLLAVPLYLLITLLALASNALGALGLDLAPLQVEAILISLLVFLGVNIAWLQLAEPKREA